VLKSEDIDYIAKCVFRINKEYNSYAYLKNAFNNNEKGMFRAYKGFKSFLKSLNTDETMAIPCVWSMVYSNHPDTLIDDAAKIKASIAVIDFSEMLMKRETLKSAASKIITNELGYMFGFFMGFKPLTNKKNLEANGIDTNRIIEIFDKYGKKYNLSFLQNK